MNTSDDQQPDRPDEESTTLHYQRADAGKFPTSVAAQQTAAEKLRDEMLNLIIQHERETVAARALAGDPNPTDADPLEYVKWIARHFNTPEGHDFFIGQLADELTLDDVRALRVAGEAAQAVTPSVVRAAAARGQKPARIADELGLTQSRVYQILREQRDQ
ncbi:hypothetical protein [Streptomyces sp. 891-h]|uniref:hypothetical protein n=1 Tax=Streptomyces sp. 891-h TaxID=2720714 RepID=UPI001FAB1C85|nr:hypothetical protein [Streptomyces sp. 891-h]UNZ18884.1 hypothetical protein HC362_19380 [Streptomyces sp. 891-h]